MEILIYQVDAFTDTVFSGNPAAICLLEKALPDHWMQSVATEMNLSETAFLVPDGHQYNLRWFTPAMEVGLCGHATLAAAHVLWESGALGETESARFKTRSGLLTAEKTGDTIRLDFPAEPAAAVAAPVDLIRALGLSPKHYVGKNRFDYLVVLDSEQAVRALQPDLALLKKLPVRGIIVTAAAASPSLSTASTSPSVPSKTYDFVSRFFAPAIGIDEDPVTGSAHCCLGPYWKKRLGRTELSACQASARGGGMRLRVLEDRVMLYGQAVTVFSGKWKQVVEKHVKSRPK